MSFKYAAILAVTVFAAPAFAEGDVAKGEKTFKKCKSCHMVKNGDDVILRGGKTGPNLYGVVGRAAATQEGFKYGKSLAKAGENGLVWDAENLATYSADPKAFLKEYLDDGAAKSKMSFKLKKGAEDVVSFLESLVVASDETAPDEVAEEPVAMEPDASGAEAEEPTVSE